MKPPGISDMPAELKKTFGRIRELDQRSRELQGQIDELCQQRIEGLLSAAQTGVPPPSIEQAAGIERGQLECLALADEKVIMAVRSYDMVDAHIQKLDKELHKLEGELVQAPSGGDKAVGGTVAPQEESKAKPSRRRVATAQMGGADSSEGMGVNADLDLPVDPNEPTYCYCGQVSFGEMIACDNPECKIEWFHYECVGITERPKGKWYCPDCRPAMQQQRRRMK